jgi:hypothetical protein
MGKSLIFGWLGLVGTDIIWFSIGWFGISWFDLIYPDSIKSILKYPDLS